MIVVVGDLHKAFDLLPDLLKDVPTDAFVVQVGDFGIWPDMRDRWAKTRRKLKHKIHFIHGNHEHFRELLSLDFQHYWPDLHYIPSGTIKVIDGRRVGFIGGGESMDYLLREEGVDWFPEERVSKHISKIFYNAPNLDLMISHSPPTDVIKRHFPLMGEQIALWKLPPGWKNISARVVQFAWQYAGHPSLVCGHMHEHIVEPEYRILDTYEVAVV